MDGGSSKSARNCRTGALPKRDFDKVDHLSGKIDELEMFKDRRGERCSWGRGSPAGLGAAHASGRVGTGLLRVQGRTSCANVDQHELVHRCGATSHSLVRNAFVRAMRSCSRGAGGGLLPQCEQTDRCPVSPGTWPVRVVLASLHPGICEQAARRLPGARDGAAPLGRELKIHRCSFSDILPRG